MSQGVGAFFPTEERAHLQVLTQRHRAELVSASLARASLLTMKETVQRAVLPARGIKRCAVKILCKRLLDVVALLRYGECRDEGVSARGSCTVPCCLWRLEARKRCSSDTARTSAETPGRWRVARPLQRHRASPRRLSQVVARNTAAATQAPDTEAPKRAACGTRTRSVAVCISPRCTERCSQRTRLGKGTPLCKFDINSPLIAPHPDSAASAGCACSACMPMYVPTPAR